MYNLKSRNGTFKGMIGECMFKLTRRYFILCKFFNLKKYLSLFENRFSTEQINFLKENWFSLDGIEFDYSLGKPQAVLTEIKTMNEQINPKANWMPSMSYSSYTIYKKALELGFSVKMAIVWLYDNWDYDIEIKDFKSLIPYEDYYIDKNAKYDKKQQG